MAGQHLPKGEQAENTRTFAGVFPEKENCTTMRDNSMRIVMAALALLLLLLGWWGYSNYRAKADLIRANEIMTRELGELHELKSELEAEVDSLVQAYESAAAENEQLKGSLAAARAEIRRKTEAIRRVQAATSDEVAGLREQIAELLEVKETLQQTIRQLEEENEQLRQEKERLTAEVRQKTQENEQLRHLNERMQEEINKLTRANFKASSFTVVLQQRNDKLTSKAARARRLRVNFEVLDVPPEYQGVRPVYLVIMDDKGTPIRVAQPVLFSVRVNGQVLEFEAVKAQEVDFGPNQRLSIVWNFERKTLKPGLYRAAVYTDIGLLGAAGFEVR